MFNYIIIFGWIVLIERLCPSIWCNWWWIYNLNNFIWRRCRYWQSSTKVFLFHPFFLEINRQWLILLLYAYSFWRFTLSTLSARTSLFLLIVSIIFDVIHYFIISCFAWFQIVFDFQIFRRRVRSNWFYWIFWVYFDIPRALRSQRWNCLFLISNLPLFTIWRLLL